MCIRDSMGTEVRLKDGRLVRSTDLWRHEVSESEGEELPGACRKAVFIHTGDQDWKLVQEFCIYEDYFTASTAFCSGSEAETNYIAPFCPCLLYTSKKTFLSSIKVSVARTVIGTPIAVLVTSMLAYAPVSYTHLAAC